MDLVVVCLFTSLVSMSSVYYCFVYMDCCFIIVMGFGWRYTINGVVGVWGISFFIHVVIFWCLHLLLSAIVTYLV